MKLSELEFGKAAMIETDSIMENVNKWNDVMQTSPMDFLMESVSSATEKSIIQIMETVVKLSKEKGIAASHFDQALVTTQIFMPLLMEIVHKYIKSTLDGGADPTGGIKMIGSIIQQVYDGYIMQFEAPEKLIEAVKQGTFNGDFVIDKAKDEEGDSGSLF